MEDIETEFNTEERSQCVGKAHEHTYLSSPIGAYQTYSLSRRDTEGGVFENDLGKDERYV
jgi:hypothetical protein